MNSCALDEVAAARGGRIADLAGIPTVADYGDPRAEYDHALKAVGLYHARTRGLIEITGGDRASWLHNLVTNAVKNLQPGEGNYAFAANVKGRILFDGNIIVLADRIWFDIDRRYSPKAMAHFDRYIISEDVRLTDRSDEFCRLALLGPMAPDVAGGLGATHAGNMASVGSTSVPLAGKHRLLVRHDFAGVTGLELYIDADDAVTCWERLLEIGRTVLRPVGHAAVEVLRIEAGLPVYGLDIDEEVLPAETQQIERAVSYVKGCYLGQEIVERMRSRGGLARKLVGLRLSGGAGVQHGSVLKAEGAEVGRLTSTCESYATGGTIGLGYVKLAHAKPGTVLAVDATEVQAQVAELPFR